MTGVVTGISDRGAQCFVTVRTTLDLTVLLNNNRTLRLAPGDEVTVSIPRDTVHLIKET